MVSRYVVHKFRQSLPDTTYHCEDCGREITKLGEGADKMRVHHIEPLETGGSDVLSNLALLCGFCHRHRHEILWKRG